MFQRHWRVYISCFYPALAIVGMLVVLFLLAQIVQSPKPSLPLRELTPLLGYPDNISLSEAALITETGLKWLMFSYCYWLAGLFSIGFCFWQIKKALSGNIVALKIKVFGFLSASLLFCLAVLTYYTTVLDVPLMSFEFIVRNLHMVGTGFADLATWNSALSYLVLVSLLVTISLLLLPFMHANSESLQINSVTQVMYCAAGFLLIWIAQSTEMYTFAALLLIAEEREQVLAITPTISLVAGLFASILLLGAYLASYICLQSRHNEEQNTRENPEDTLSPKHFLKLHWPKVTAVLMPVFPGALGSVLNLFAQPM